ncbi:hypothetical protein PV327_008531 [Microctonus hyperodae]|uniref:Uncharacterized protein n=1 Tax=Microctonus hyperodae TaxID=165561 RepID=A0AA39F3C3_MICHY|nr:hypothetical protein PV327_008531 [Microctonus hyperodae]
MNNKSSLLLSSLEKNTAKTITGITIRQITSMKQQWSTSSFVSHPTHSNVSSLIKVKKELFEDEIKQEYAANAMSELLGWYGYDKVESKYTNGLNLEHFKSLTSSKNNCNHRQQSYLQSDIIGPNYVNNPNLSNADTQASTSEAVQSLQSPSTSNISVISNTEIDVTQASSSVLSKTATVSPRTLENDDSASDFPGKKIEKYKR